MKKIGIIILSLIIIFGMLYYFNIGNISNILFIHKGTLANEGYVGKYSMIGALKISEDEYDELIENEEENILEHKKAYSIRKDGMSFDDLELGTEILFVKISDNKDVNIYIGGPRKWQAKLSKEGKKTYIIFDNIFLKNYGKKFLLVEKYIDGIQYLTIEISKDKIIYLEKLENQGTDSAIDIYKDGTFELRGLFEIDSNIEVQKTGHEIQYLWGPSFKIYGTQMFVNDDGTGNYRIGKAEIEKFKIIEKNKKMYMEILHKEVDLDYIEDIEEPETYLMEAYDINGETYIYVDKGHGQYWKMINKDADVFKMLDGEIYIWN